MEVPKEGRPLVFPAPWPNLAWTWADAQNAPLRFVPGKMAQASYVRTLRNLARKITHILAKNDLARAEDILRRYGKEVEPWAEAKARDMLARVNRDNANQFARLSRQMGLDVRAFLRDAAVGKAASAILRKILI